MPNLEQTGLLRISYRDLAEIAADEEAWAGLPPALREDDPDHRQEVAAALLDELRRNLAIDVEYLTEDGFDLVAAAVRAASEGAVVAARARAPADRRAWPSPARASRGQPAATSTCPAAASSARSSSASTPQGRHA